MKLISVDLPYRIWLKRSEKYSFSNIISYVIIFHFFLVYFFFKGNAVSIRRFHLLGFSTITSGRDYRFQLP